MHRHIYFSTQQYNAFAVEQNERLQLSETTTVKDTDIITRKLHQSPAKIFLLHGHSSVFQMSLFFGAQFQQPIAVIDGSMRFNSYSVSKIATLLHLPAKDVLRRTHITRSFTAFQTEAAVTTKLVRFLQSTPCKLVIVLGLLDTYYDEQVKPNECQQSLQRVMHTLKELTKQNIFVLLADVNVSNPPKGKESLFEIVRKNCDSVYQLYLTNNQFQLTEQWDVTMIPSR